MSLDKISHMKVESIEDIDDVKRYLRHDVIQIKSILDQMDRAIDTNGDNIRALNWWLFGAVCGFGSVLITVVLASGILHLPNVF